MPSDIPGHLGLAPPLGGHSQRVGGQVRPPVAGESAQHHQMLRDDVEGDDDGLTDEAGGGAAQQRLHLVVAHTVGVQHVPHTLIRGHVAEARHHLDRVEKLPGSI